MVGDPLVATEIPDQLGPAGWKRQSRIEMSLMDRERGIYRSAATMDDD
jgi:hypothetical protein